MWPRQKYKKVLFILLKIFGWTALVVFILVAGILITIQLPPVQNYIADKATAFITEKIKSEVHIGDIKIAFPKQVVIKDIFVRDLHKDTLLHAGLIKADISLLALISQKISISSLRVENLTSHINRTMPDSAFNFDFITEAFGDTTADKEVKADTTGEGWGFSIGKIFLKSINVTYSDETNGTDLSASVGNLVTEFDEFNLEEQLFDLDLAELTNTKAKIVMSKKTPEKEDEEPSRLRFMLDKLKLENVNLDYEDIPGGQRLIVSLGKSTATDGDLNLQNNQFKLNDFSLSGTKGNIIMTTPVDLVDTAAKLPSDKGPEWTLLVSGVELESNSFSYDDFTKPVLKSGIDFNHLGIIDAVAKIRDINFSGEQISADIQKFSFGEKKGFVLEQFSAELLYDSSHAVLEDLYIKTNGSKIKDHIAISYTSPEMIGKSPGEIIIDTKLKRSRIAFSDILFFQPALAASSPFKGNADGYALIDADLSGPINNLSINKFILKTEHATILDAEGSLRGLPDAGKLYFSIELNQFRSTKDDLTSLLKGYIPATINLPATIQVKGKYTGTMKIFEANADIKTSSGNAAIFAKMSAGEKFIVNADVNNFDLGSLLRQKETLGSFSLTAKTSGTGLSAETMNAKIDVNVSKAVIKKYEYNNFLISGHFEQKVFSGLASIKDENLEFGFNGTVSLNKEQPVYNFSLDLKGADLYALHLSEDKLKISGIITSELTGNDLNNINGQLAIREIFIIKDQKTIAIDSLMFASVIKEKQTNINITSPVFTANFKGTINPGDLPAVLEQHLDKYFTLRGGPVKESLEPQKFDFEINIHDPEVLAEVFVPDLKSLVPGEIKGHYNSEQSDLSISFFIPEIIYSDLVMDSISINISSDAEKLVYSAGLSELRNPTIVLENPILSGEVKNETIFLSLRVSDDNKKEKLLLSGNISSTQEGYSFAFIKDGFRLNEESWNINDDGYVIFGSRGFYINKMTIENNNRMITLISPDPSKESLNILFKNFDLTLLSKVVEDKEPLIAGILNGEFNIIKFNAFTFTSDLSISNTSYKGIAVGEINLMAKNVAGNKYELDLILTGNQNDLKISGNYASGEKESLINLTLNANNLNLASVEAFTAGQVKRMSGTMKGRMTIGGSTSKPELNGSLSFSQAAFNPTFLNSYMKLNKGEIVFDRRGINLNTIALTDSLNNKAFISGDILTPDYRNFTFNVDVSTNNFLLMNSKQEEDKDFYGIIILDSRIKIKGTQNKPVIQAGIKLKKGSDFTYITPKENIAEEQSKGIVEFVDPVIPTRSSIMVVEQTEKDTTRLELKGIDLVSNVEIDTDSRLKIVIDPIAGDSLVIKGKGILSLGIDPSGKISLTGRYEISEGKYRVSFNEFVNKDFEIENGSSILWTGGPTDATVDIRAVHTVKTSPLELVEDQVAGLDDQQKKQYRQNLPFQVFLFMQGKILKPELRFEIQLPPEERGALNGTVYAKLQQLNQQESELNKQVFALVVLNRFISQDPFTSGETGTGLGTAARTSVSKFLGQQLNSLSKKYVKGVDINIGLESYEYKSGSGTEGKTELQVGVSKQFLDERVTVQVGSNFDLEGENRRQENLSDIAGDVSVEYKITKDGIYRLKGFRNNVYEGVIEGQITKTGVGVIFTRDYNKLDELFNRRKDDDAE